MRATQVYPDAAEVHTSVAAAAWRPAAAFVCSVGTGGAEWLTGSKRGPMTRDGLCNELPALLPRLWRFALRLAGDRHDAEDLVQRACVRALERPHQLQPGTSTLSWMFSIVYSVWLNEVRARQTRRHGSIQWTDELADTVADPAALSPETYTLNRQIISAVERLPDAQRAVMLLVAVEGLSYREAATALDVPIGTVMSRLARARQTIGESFAAPLPDETRAADVDTFNAQYSIAKK